MHVQVKYLLIKQDISLVKKGKVPSSDFFCQLQTSTNLKSTTARFDYRVTKAIFLQNLDPARSGLEDKLYPLHWLKFEGA